LIDIATKRKAAGYSTQEQFAADLGVPRSTVAKWEAKLAEPNITSLIELARVFKCSVDELLKEDVSA